MFKIWHPLTKVEKIAVTFLLLAAAISGYKITSAFYLEHSVLIPKEGGLYREGAIGKIGPLNPLFVQHGSVAYDITQLIFSGLTKYDPESMDIVPDLAQFTVSGDGKEYTFVIKEEAKWHDGQPVTSADVLFTYETVIHDPGFKGAILSANDYSGMKVSKIDERTVKFLLEKPNSFFLVKTMTGILPYHLLQNTPPSLLAESPFNLAPIGSGRYKFVSLSPINNHIEVSMEAFDGFYDTIPHIQSIMFDVFSDEKELTKHLGKMDGIRTVSDDMAKKILEKTDWVLERYHLPQYVAVFLNNESAILKNKKVRLALQLGTNKEGLIESIGENQAVDTPLLEIDNKNWMHQFSLKKANGALYDTEWKLPDKKAPEPIANEGVNTEKSSYINGPNGGNDWKTTKNKVTITGIAPARTKTISVNDYELQKFIPNDKAWSYVASEEFGNLKKGDNIFNIYAIDFKGEKKFMDGITITYWDQKTLDEMDREKLTQENIEAAPLPARINQKSDRLVLRLITTQTPPTYPKIAEMLKKQWKLIGVETEIYALNTETFQERLKSRDYDMLLFGQNLGYNLDAYPYWHSSQAKENGFNLSQFKNFAADSLLEAARLENNPDERHDILNSIQKIMSQEVPAIFLYSPTYTFAHRRNIQDVSLEHLATSSDRFATLDNWYASGKRRLKEGVNVLSFVQWLIKQF